MGVQVNVDLNFTILNLLINSFLNGVDRRLVYWTWIYVISIQVLSKRIKSIVASVDPIRIQHWHNLEYEALSEHLRLQAFFICQNFPDTSEHERGRGLTRMNSRRNKNSWLVEPEGPRVRVALCFGEKSFN